MLAKVRNCQVYSLLHTLYITSRYKLAAVVCRDAGVQTTPTLSVQSSDQNHVRTGDDDHSITQVELARLQQEKEVGNKNQVDYFMPIYSNTLPVGLVYLFVSLSIKYIQWNPSDERPTSLYIAATYLGPNCIHSNIIIVLMLIPPEIGPPL